VRLLGGLLLWVTTLYCAPAARTGKGRGREGGGVYPELGVLGIQEGSSPALVREVARQVALLPSYALSREEMARRGLDLDIKEIYGIGKYAGAAALTYRRRLLEQYRAGLLVAGSEWAGKRLGVFVDGGRTKIRTTTRRQKGRGKHKTQRRRYRTVWREPKLLIIVELDQRGRTGRTHQTFCNFAAPAKSSARYSRSRAAALRFRTMLSLAGFCLRRLNAIFRSRAKFAAP
jgi:hypothetical protein